jgi:hypothetical protein
MGLTPAERQRRHREKKYREWAEGPKVPCECGCGEFIPAITKNGEPAHYKHGHNPHGLETRFAKGSQPSEEWREWRATQRGPNHFRWNGGQWMSRGYVRVALSEEQAKVHPTALYHGRGWSIQRSHLVWNTAHPDDLVLPGENIHHLNKQRDDDRLENLHKMPKREHIGMHSKADPRPRDNRGRFCSS